MFTTMNLPCIMNLDLDLKKRLSGSVFHKGRTDKNGGHNDFFNKSGLGLYHYHHGFAAHLHSDNQCKYDNNQTFIINPHNRKKIALGKPYVFEGENYYSINLITPALVNISYFGGLILLSENADGAFYICY